MINRSKKNKILDLLQIFPVVGIVGARQVGKTTLAKQLIPEMNYPVIYLDLELISDMQKLENPEFYLKQHSDKCVIIDEIQHKPELFGLLRSLIDQDRRPGRFVILGSASPELLRQSSESLAGRISYVQLFPFIIEEIENNYKLEQIWFKGGFPPALLSSGIKTARQWLADFIKAYVERDLPSFGLGSSPQQTMRFWTMLAHLNGQLLNYSGIGRSLGLSSPTVKSYVDFFENSFLIKRLEPYSFNIKKRIVKSPRIYLSDTGILHRLLNISDFEHLQANPVIGNSWEAFVYNQINAVISPDVETCFYRTKDGSEIDLVFVKSLKAVASAEIKFTSTPSLTAGNTRAINTLGTRLNFIITPHSEDYLLRPDVRICNILDFLSKYLPEIEQMKL